MPVETRAMKRAREAQGVYQTAATTPTAATTTTTTARRAPRKKATATKGAKETKSKGEAKAKKGVNKVQKNTKNKKGGTTAVRKAKQKAKGKRVADEDEVEEQEPEPGPGPEPGSDADPESAPEPDAKEKEVLLSKWKNKEQMSTKPKKSGLGAIFKAEQKATAQKMADIRKGKRRAIAEDKEKPEVKQQFTRADLQEAGALELDHVQMPNLTNAIHPIWALEKFHFFNGNTKAERAEAYDAISPALQLASLWIERPQYEGFWAPMWHGEYIKGNMTRILQPTEDKMRSLKKVSAEEGLTWKGFQDLASTEEFKCEWRFGPQDAGTLAKTEEGIDGFSGCVTTLHDDFEWLARFPQPSTTTSERLRLYFFLAFNLCRESVQQVCRFQYRIQHGNDVEPLDTFFAYYQTSPTSAEPWRFLNQAWEKFMFKGWVYQINSPRGPMTPDGLAVKYLGLENESAGVYMPLRMDWISELFSMGLWLADDSDEDMRLPGLPDGSKLHARELVIDHAH